MRHVEHVRNAYVGNVGANWEEPQNITVHHIILSKLNICFISNSAFVMSLLDFSKTLIKLHMLYK